MVHLSPSPTRLRTKHSSSGEDNKGDPPDLAPPMSFKFGRSPFPRIISFIKAAIPSFHGLCLSFQITRPPRTDNRQPPPSQTGRLRFIKFFPDPKDFLTFFGREMNPQRIRSRYQSAFPSPGFVTATPLKLTCQCASPVKFGGLSLDVLIHLGSIFLLFGEFHRYSEPVLYSRDAQLSLLPGVNAPSEMSCISCLR